MPPDLSIELTCTGPVAGVDEAGRGPLAGPVVAAAVILDPAHIPAGIDDSKKVGASRRAALVDEIRAVATVGVGIASVAEIDRLNILWATMLAMERAVAALDAQGQVPGHVLVDGNRLPRWDRPSRFVIGGDAKCLSIAAASIIAKEERDRMMRDLDALHPGYGWARNMGYGTADHRAALAEMGPTPHHRTSFAPVAQLLLGL